LGCCRKQFGLNNARSKSSPSNLWPWSALHKAPSTSIPFLPALQLQLNYGGHWSHNYKLLLTSKMAIQKHNPGLKKGGGDLTTKNRGIQEEMGGISVSYVT